MGWRWAASLYDPAGESQAGFYEHAIRVAAVGRQRRKQPAIEDLEEPDGQQYQLLVNLQAWVQYRQKTDQREPDKVHPAKGGVFATSHIRHDSTVSAF